MNCEGNTYNIGMGCCVPILAPIENYYTKWQIDKMLSGETSGCCITPEEVDEKISSAITEVEGEIPSLDGYATEEYVNQSVSGKADSDDLATVSGDVQSLSAEVQTIIISGVSGVSSAECQSMIDEAVSGKLDTSVFQTYSGSINTEMDNKQDISGMTAYTQNESFTAHTADTNVHVTSSEKQAWNNKANVWSGSEADWALISGSTEANTIYLIY